MTGTFDGRTGLEGGGGWVGTRGVEGGWVQLATRVGWCRHREQPPGVCSSLAGAASGGKASGDLSSRSGGTRFCNVRQGSGVGSLSLRAATRPATGGGDQRLVCSGAHHTLPPGTARTLL